MLTPEQIKGARAKLGINPVDKVVENRVASLDAAWNPPRELTGVEKFGKGAYELTRDLGTGVAKGGTSTLLGLGGIGRSIQEGIGTGIDTLSGGRTNLAATARGGIFDPNSRAGARAREIVTPKNTAEQVGFGAEQIGEFFIPAGAATKAEKAVTTASAALPGIWGAASRILGKSAVQGIAAGGVRAAQTGGDLEEAGKAALGAGLVRGAFATVGEGANALKVPERLYQTIFKNTKNDMLHELDSNALINWQKSNPEEFASLVEAGIVKAGKDGIPKVNTTLAEAALERGLKGSVQTMADTVVKGAHRSEAAARKIAATHPEKLDLSAPQFKNVLDEVAAEYQNVGFGEVADEANILASRLELGGGKVDATTALQLRRFFDRLRLASSFDKPVSKLSMTQANFKTLADAVRSKVNAIPGMKDVMKDYGFYLDALDALAQHAKRTGNSQALSLIDSIFLGAGLGTGSAAPVWLGAARKVANLPGVLTSGAQGLKAGIMGPGAGGVMNAAIGAATAEPK